MGIGLALSGGGIKGAAHIGVLQALAEEKIDIDYISGTSCGSIIATLYACGYLPLNILSMFKTYARGIADCDKTLPFKLFKTIFTGKVHISGLAKGNKLEYLMKKYCEDKKINDISQIKLPIAISTVDINSGEIIYFLNKRIKQNRNYFDDIPTYKYYGDIASIVRASSSLPGVFEPKLLDGKLLVDGGVRVNSPISILKIMGARKTVVVSFDKNKQLKRKCDNIVSIAMQSFDIMGHQVNKEELDEADIILNPNISDIRALDFSSINQIATEGYKVTKQNIEKIKKLLEK